MALTNHDLRMLPPLLKRGSEMAPTEQFALRRQQKAGIVPPAIHRLIPLSDRHLADRSPSSIKTRWGICPIHLGAFPPTAVSTDRERWRTTATCWGVPILLNLHSG